MVKLFLIKNNILKDSINVKWDKSTDGEELNSKVDDDNQFNVIYQNDFEFENRAQKDGDDIAKDVLDNCFKNFNKNKYPIIIIEDYNGGGSKDISDYLTEY